MANVKKMDVKNMNGNRETPNFKMLSNCTEMGAILFIGLKWLQSIFSLFVFLYIDLNPCEPNPCQHDGKCERKGRKNYKCECKDDWTGKNCEDCKYMAEINLAGPETEI